MARSRRSRAQARVEEIALVAGQAVPGARGPVARLGQPRSAVEGALVLGHPLPLVGGGAQGALDPQVIETVLDPTAQPRPLAQKRLVRQLDRALADRHQPVVREYVEQRLGLAAQVRQRKPAALDTAVIVDLDELEQHPAGELALLVVEVGERLLGQPRHGAPHAAGLLVGGQAQAPPVPVLPELEQRGRNERQRAGRVLDVVDDRLHQLVLHRQADALGRAGDRAPQLLGPHRADEHVVGGEQTRERRVLGAAAVEVGAQRDHDDGVRLAARARR